MNETSSNYLTLCANCRMEPHKNNIICYRCEETQLFAIPLLNIPWKRKVKVSQEEKGEGFSDTKCVLCNKECTNILGLNEHIVTHIGCISTMASHISNDEDEVSCDANMEVDIACNTSEHNYSVKDPKEDTSVSNVNVKVRHIKCWIDDSNVSEKYYYSCTLCGTKKFTFSNLSTHIKQKCLLPGFLEKESEKGDARSPVVPKKKPRTEVVRFYVRSPKEKKGAPLKCRLCDKTFSYLSALKVHMNSHKARPRFLCITCGRSYHNRVDLLDHTKTHKDEPASCEQCGVTYRNAIMLKTHMLSHTGTHPHQCDRCDQGFLFEVDLKRHLKHEHDYVQRDFRCPTCRKMFTSAVRLAMHQSTYCKAPSPRPRPPPPPPPSPSIWLCSVCGKSLGSRTSLVKHEKWVHGKQQQKLQTCTTCNKMFPYREQFRRHMKWHQGPEKVACHVCGCLCTVASLRVHLTSHSQQRPFVCECGSTFKRSSHLRNHKKKVHNMKLPGQRDNRPIHFSCYICGETFEGRKEQKKHIDLHHRLEKEQSMESTQIKQLE